MRPAVLSSALLSTALLSLGLALTLTGCQTGIAAPAVLQSNTTTAMQGIVHGGQSPISGAKIYLYAPTANSFYNHAQTNIGSNVTWQYPGNIALDSARNLYVPNSGANDIVELYSATNYTTSTVVGGYTNIAYGGAVVVDNSGDVFYVSNNSVDELVAVSGVVPNNPTPAVISSTLNAPQGLTLDAAGNLYVTEAGGNDLKKFTVASNYTATPTTLASGFSNPVGVTVDTSGNIYVCDFLNNVIRELVAVSGTVSVGATVRTLGSGTLSQPTDIVIDAAGDAYVTSAGNNLVDEILAVNGTIPTSNESFNSIGSGYNNPYGVALDSLGNVFVSDLYNQRIEKLATTTPVVTASTSLLTAGTGLTADSHGLYYATTSATGGFTIPAGSYPCTIGQPAYLYSLSGNAGTGTANPSAGLLAALGNCAAGGTFTGVSSLIKMDEITTVAAAYAMAGFATDATHVSYSGSALSLTGIQNAFATAANLASLSTGLPLTTTPAGNGTAPASTVTTLANVLAACINSASPFTPCTTLFSNTPDSAAFAGATATDSATAAIHLAHNPYPSASAMSTIFFLTGSQPPFPSGLSTQPNDFSLGINYTGAGMTQPQAIAIDASGDVWSVGGGTFSEISPLGAALSPTAGYTPTYLSGPGAIALDNTGDPWITNSSSVTKNSSSGTELTNISASVPVAVALDANNNVWIAGVPRNAYGGRLTSGGTSFSTFGTPAYESFVAIDGAGSAWYTSNQTAGITECNRTLTSSNSFTGGGATPSGGIAIDKSGNAWSSNNNQSLTETSNAGAALSGSGGFTGGGTATQSTNPIGISIDGGGNVWVAQGSNGAIGINVDVFNSSGTAISPATGYQATGIIHNPYTIAVDGSGNVWLGNYGVAYITEIIGAAIPVITPINAGLPTTYTTNGTSLLGTRP